MVPDTWLRPSLVLVATPVSSVDELIRRVAAAAAKERAASAEHLERALGEAVRRGGFSVGRGVAVPHIDIEGFTETLVVVAITRQPLALTAIDGIAPDVFFFILSRPSDPHGHLLLLAHLARLAQSHTLLDGLRRATDPEQAITLIRAAELRHSPAVTPVPITPSAPHALAVISLSGERPVDALLVELAAQGFRDACVLEAQSLKEAMTHEVPLFAEFRDIFGDPGGRRVLFVEVETGRAETLIASVRRVCAEQRAADVQVSIVPLLVRWQSTVAAGDRESKEPP